jgi:hypothetical protein
MALLAVACTRAEATPSPAPAEPSASIAPTPSAFAIPSASASAEAPPARREPGTILFIGDSYMFGAFGKTMDASLRTVSKGGDSVWTHSSCGSSPLTWLEGISTNCGEWNHFPGLSPFFRPGDATTPRFSGLLDKYKPDVTVILLGINFIKFEERVAPHIRRMIDELKRAKSRCIWIGPPKSGKFSDAAVEKANEMLQREAAGYCDMVWSSRITKYPQGYMDGVHYDPIAAKAWADRAFEDVRGFVEGERPAARD